MMAPRTLCLAICLGILMAETVRVESAEPLPPPTAAQARPTPPPLVVAPVDPYAPLDIPETDVYYDFVANGILWPFEVYFRGGPTYDISIGPFDDVLNVGVAAETGVRSFWYNPDRSAAWTGHLGVDYSFNRGNQDVPIVIRRPLISVTTQLGQNLLVPAQTEYGIREFHRIYFRIGGGHQWYWRGDDIRYYVGVDAGARVGHASAKLNPVRFEFLPGTTVRGQPSEDFEIQPGDQAIPLDEARATDIARGLYLGADVGCLIPYGTFELAVGLRVEYGHDIIRLPGLFQLDDSLDQLKALLSLGIRY